MVERVEAGNLSINTLEASVPEAPVGAVRSSGYGREGGSDRAAHLRTTIMRPAFPDRWAIRASF